MKRSRSANRRSALSAALCIVASAAGASGQTSNNVFYSSTTLSLERCLPPCACALNTISGPGAGTFELVLTSIGDVFDFYEIRSIDLWARTQTGYVRATGQGQYRVSTIARLQAIDLDITIGNVTMFRVTSDVVPLVDDPPMVNIIAASEVQGCQRLTLHIVGGPPRCVADVDDGSGRGVPDGGVGVEDLLYYLGQYSQGAAQADLTGGPCACPDCVCPDGGVGIEDLLFYLRRFDRGC